MVKHGIPEAFAREHTLPDTNDYIGMAGYAFNEETGKTLFYMHLETPEHPGVVAHEAIHSAYRMLEYVGVEVDPDNHEALTYLVTWIMEQFYEQFSITKINCKRTTAKDVKKKKQVRIEPPVQLTKKFGNWTVKRRLYVRTPNH